MHDIARRAFAAAHSPLPVSTGPFRAALSLPFADTIDALNQRMADARRPARTRGVPGCGPTMVLAGIALANRPGRRA
jgi:hypothetical protein